MCRIMSRKISEIYRDSEVIAIPAADGGEGSVDVFMKVFGGVRVRIEAKDKREQTLNRWHIWTRG